MKSNNATNTSSAVIPFNFESQQVRVITRDGEHWFVAADVCAVLDLANTSHAVSRLDEDEKDIIQNDTLGGKQEMLVVSESGLYSLVLRSDKPQAKPFRKWVTSEVIPSIRKTGQYQHPKQVAPAPPVIEQVNHQVIDLELARSIALCMRSGMEYTQPTEIHQAIKDLTEETAQGVIKLCEETRKHALLLAKERIDRLVKDLVGDVQPPPAPPAPQKRCRKIPFSLPEALPNTNAQEQEFMRIFNETGNATRAYREVFPFDGPLNSLHCRASRLVKRLACQLSP